MDAAVQKERLNAFVKETGAEPEIAAHYLEYQKWDVAEAVRGFRAMKVQEEKFKSRSKEELSKDVVERPNSAGGRNGKLSRGFSMANTELVANLRTYMREQEKLGKESEFEFFEDTPNHSFILPNITKKNKEYIDFLKGDLIDKHTYISLLDAGQLNWWSEKTLCRKLFPLSTVGDGNCLLHAASLGMWGFHDRLLTLREALYRTVTSSMSNGALRRRWKYAQWQLNMKVGGLTFTKEEWDEEWKEIVRLAYYRPRSSNEKPNRRISRQFTLASSPLRQGVSRTLSEESDSYESLEEFHVFVLAHVLRRPIIIVADITLKDLHGQPLAPIPFRGIYLPLEVPPSQCYRYPLLLAYDSGHFAALVAAEGEECTKDGLKLSTSIPLVDANSELLPIHYLIDPGTSWDSIEDDQMKRSVPDMNHEEKIGLLIEYLEVLRVAYPEKKDSALAKLTHPKPAAKTAIIETHLKVKELKGGSLRIKDHKGDKSPMISRALQSVSNLFVSSPNGSIITAKLDVVNKPSFYDEMIANYMISAEKRFQMKPGRTEVVKKEATPCLTPGCSMYGTAENNYMCSSCYKTQRQSAAMMRRTASASQSSDPKLHLNAVRSRTDPDLGTKQSVNRLERRSSDGSHGIYTNTGREQEQSSNNSKWYDITVEVSDRPQSAPPQKLEETQPPKTTDLILWPCESANCKFFGSEQYGGYCRSCFDRQKQEGVFDSEML